MSKGGSPALLKPRAEPAAAPPRLPGRRRRVAGPLAGGREGRPVQTPREGMKKEGAMGGGRSPGLGAPPGTRVEGAAALGAARAAGGEGKRRPWGVGETQQGGCLISPIFPGCGRGARTAHGTSALRRSLSEARAL